MVGLESGNSTGSSLIFRLSFLTSGLTFCFLPDLSFLDLPSILPLSAPDSPPDMGDSMGDRGVANIAEIGLGSDFTTGEGDLDMEEREW